MTIGAPFCPLPQSNVGSTSIEVHHGLGRTFSQDSGVFAQQLHMINDYRRVSTNTPPSFELNKTASDTSSTGQRQQSTTTPPPHPISADTPVSIENVCDDDPPLSRIFVRCNQAMTKDELQELFSQYGEVQQLKLITIKATNKFKGKLFVKYAKASSAALAIEELNGKDVKGSALTVQLAESYRTSVERRAMMVDEADYPPFSRLFITCPPHLTYQELHKIFSEFGGVQHIVLLKDKHTQASRGLGFVKYSTASAASLAATNFSKPSKDRHPILCRIAEPRSTHRSQKMANNSFAPLAEELFFQNASDACHGDANSANAHPYDAGQQGNALAYVEQSSEPAKQSLLEFLVQLAASETQPPVQPMEPQYTEVPPTCDCEECLTSALLLLLTNQSPANPVLSEGHVPVHLPRHYASLSADNDNHTPMMSLPPPLVPFHNPSKSATKTRTHPGVSPHVARVAHPLKHILPHNTFAPPVPPHFPIPLNGLTPSIMPPPMPPTPVPSNFPLISSVETSGPFPSDSRLFITFARQLPPEVLQTVFGQYGTLAYAYLLSDRNYGFVQYYSAASAKLAIEALNNRSVLGVPCRVLIADPYTKKKMPAAAAAQQQQQPTMMMPVQEDQRAMIGRIAELLAAQDYY